MISPKGMNAEYSNCSVTSWSRPPLRGEQVIELDKKRVMQMQRLER
jgi:hypothetical protein